MTSGGACCVGRVQRGVGAGLAGALGAVLHCPTAQKLTWHAPCLEVCLMTLSPHLRFVFAHLHADHLSSHDPRPGDGWMRI